MSSRVIFIHLDAAETITHRHFDLDRFGKGQLVPGWRWRWKTGSVFESSLMYLTERYPSIFLNFCRENALPAEDMGQGTDDMAIGLFVVVELKQRHGFE